MKNDTLEQRVDALEKDMSSVKADLAELKKQPPNPEDVDGMIDGLVYAAVQEAYSCAVSGDEPDKSSNVPARKEG